MTPQPHDPLTALAQRAAEHVNALPPDQRNRAREAMDAGEVYLRPHPRHVEVRLGRGDDALTIHVDRLTVGPRPDHAADN